MLNLTIDWDLDIRHEYTSYRSPVYKMFDISILKGVVINSDENTKKIWYESAIGILLIIAEAIVISLSLSVIFLGTVNIHPSLLPLYRGAAPVQRALQVALLSFNLVLQFLYCPCKLYNYV